MFWYNIKSSRYTCYFAVIFIVTNSIGCKPNAVSKKNELKYFDLKGYFISEAARLTLKNKAVEKAATYNKSTESKTIFIQNWEREFDFFISSDINKPSWKDSYTIEKSEDLLIYRAKFKELKLREMIVKIVDNKIKWVFVYNTVNNVLYYSSEQLSYFPDSLYQIEKQQKVKFLNKNYFRIKEKF